MLPASAVPVMVGVESLVSVGDTTVGESGAVVSMESVRGAETGLTFPSGSRAVAVRP